MWQLKSLLEATIFRFLTVGVLNTLLGLLVIYAAKYFADMGDALANLVGYVVGIVFSYALNSRWTFRYSGPELPVALKYVLVVLTAYCANLITVLALIHVLGVNSYFAQATGIPAYTVVAYLLSRYFAFRPSPAATLANGGES
jgi:putative flippase GtrA